jgi:dienelactone hydrolase
VVGYITFIARIGLIAVTLVGGSSLTSAEDRSTPNHDITPESNRANGRPFKAATMARSEVGERIEFDSMARGRNERVWGYLNFPSQRRMNYPLMLIMHSSGGLHERDWFFARTLNEMGIASFVLDSFGPRGLTKVSEDKSSFGEEAQAIDALTAIELLQKDARIDFKRFGAMGRSLGGQTAVRLSLKASRDQLLKKGPYLSLALSITPGCTSQQQDRHLTPQSQVWLFLAEKDAAPYRRCIVFVEKMQAVGGDAHYKVYADAYHTFDASAKLIWTANQEVYAGCENDRISPHYSIRLDTGAALRTKKDWAQFFAGCVHHGMWVGGNPDATRQLDRDWVEVVRKRWLGG